MLTNESYHNTPTSFLIRQLTCLITCFLYTFCTQTLHWESLTERHREWLQLQREIADSPINWDVTCKIYDIPTIESRLQDYPSCQLKTWYFHLLRKGTDLFLTKKIEPRLCNSNPFYDYDHLIWVGKKIKQWRNSGFIIGPFDKAEATRRGIVTNMLFHVPKPDGTSRPILHCSDPGTNGIRLNKHVQHKWQTVEYVQQKELIEILIAAGRNAYLWAKDVVDGFYNISVRADLVRVFGFWFDNQIYCLQRLPMGFTASPRLFTEFMSFPMWSIRHEFPDLFYTWVPLSQVRICNFRAATKLIAKDGFVRIPLLDIYMDDILGVHPDESTAWDQWHKAEEVLAKFGLPTKKAKARPPDQINIWLGKEYNTIRQWVRLAPEKVVAYLLLIDDVLTKTHIDGFQMLSLVGKARNMGTVYKPLFAFARGLEAYVYKDYHSVILKQLQKHNGDRSKIDFAAHLRPHISLCPSLRRDIAVLKRFMQIASKYGTPFSYFVRDIHKPDVTLWTDASLTVGVGGYSDDGFYVQHKWSSIVGFETSKRDIVWKELCGAYILLLAYVKHKKDIKDICIHLFTDNEAVKYMLINMRSHLCRPDLQILINAICELLITNRIHLWVDWIKGTDNIVADALSRYFENPFATLNFRPRWIPCRALLRNAFQLCKDIHPQQKFLKFESDDL